MKHDKMVLFKKVRLVYDLYITNVKCVEMMLVKDLKPAYCNI